MTRRDRGFTLAEVLVATAIIGVGFAGIAGALGVAGYTIREGRYRSTAVLLADERSEQARALRWHANEDCLGVSPSADRPPVTGECPGVGAGSTLFPDEAPGSLPAPFEQFGRSVRVHACAAPGVCPVTSAELRIVTVVVAYAPTSGLGGNVGGARQSLVITRLRGRTR